MIIVGDRSGAEPPHVETAPSCIRGQSLVRAQLHIPRRSPKALVPNVSPFLSDFAPPASLGCRRGAKCFVPVKYRQVLGRVQQSLTGFFAMSLQSYSPQGAVVLHQV